MLLASGCVSVPTGQIIEPAGLQPTIEQARIVILEDLQRNLRDPYSLRDFSITSGPDLVTGTTAGNNFEQAWLVCVEYNARNAYGAYTGIQTRPYPLRFSGSKLFVVSTINWISQSRRC